jgi:serine/threonine protein phosphatase 1
MTDRTADAAAEPGGLGPSAFGPAVAPHVRTVEAADWQDIYVVGDVHGCLDRLEALLDRLTPGPEDLLVFVGDLLGKGPDGPGVLELVSDAPNMVSVRGNHEQALIDREAGARPSEGPAPGPRELREMPVVVTFEDAMVVHGGVDPRRPLAEHTAEQLVTMRSVPPGNGYDGPFWFESYEGPPRVLFGHTVLAEPLVTDWAVGLDTGCVYGGRLTAYDYRAGEPVSVAGAGHRSRPDRKFLRPGAPGER